MDVDAAAGGNIQNPLGQDPAIGNHRDHIGLQLPQGIHIFIGAEILRLENGDVICKGNFLHRRKNHFHTPALGTVRLGINTHHLKSVGQDSF